MPVVTEPQTAVLAAAVETSFLDPLESITDAYRKAVTYVQALPETSGNPRIDSHRAWFLGRMEMLEERSSRQSEIEYIHGKCAYTALEIGWHHGDLAHDWRR